MQKKLPKNFFVPQNSYEQTAKKVYDLLVENSKRTFYVGGMVRDLLLGKKITDIDIATDLKPETVIKLLISQGYKLDLKGKQFGVVMIKYKNQLIDISTLRQEVYKTSRFPQVTFTKDLKKDAQRRDFTINSLYFEQKNNVLIDPSTGLKDLKAKRLKLIGEPNIKLIQDPLRILRAFRLAKELNLSLESKTKQALHNNFSSLNTLSKKRLLSEISKSKTKTTENYLTKLFQKPLQK